jgi:hypothetical protein
MSPLKIQNTHNQHHPCRLSVFTLGPFLFITRKSTTNFFKTPCIKSYAIVHTSLPRSNLSRSGAFFALASSSCMPIMSSYVGRMAW